MALSAAMRRRVSQATGLPETRSDIIVRGSRRFYRRESDGKAIPIDANGKVIQTPRQAVAMATGLPTSRANLVNKNGETFYRRDFDKKAIPFDPATNRVTRGLGKKLINRRRFPR